MSAPASELTVSQYENRLRKAADQIAWATRTENPETIRAVIDAAIQRATVPGGPNPVYALITALAAQIDTDVPLRDRDAWTTYGDAVNPPPQHRPSSAAFRGSGGLGWSWDAA